jgi:hypothetical protein
MWRNSEFGQRIDRAGGAAIDSVVKSLKILEEKY